MIIAEIILNNWQLYSTDYFYRGLTLCFKVPCNWMKTHQTKNLKRNYHRGKKTENEEMLVINNILHIVNSNFQI